MDSTERSESDFVFCRFKDEMPNEFTFSVEDRVDIVVIPSNTIHRMLTVNQRDMCSPSGIDSF